MVSGRLLLRVERLRGFEGPQFVPELLVFLPLCLYPMAIDLLELPAAISAF